MEKAEYGLSHLMKFLKKHKAEVAAFAGIDSEMG